MKTFVTDVITLLQSWGAYEVQHVGKTRFFGRCPKKHGGQERFTGRVSWGSALRFLKVRACETCGEVRVDHTGLRGDAETVVLKVLRAHSSDSPPLQGQESSRRILWDL